VRSMFGGLTFTKGPLVLHMLRHVMGDDPFMRALRQYVADFAYSTVTTRDFQHEAEAAWGHPLDDFFDKWVFGSGPLPLADTVPGAPRMPTGGS
jgi:aminopeptidase N